MDEFSPESDMLGDVDGVAMTSTSSAAGFVFDPSQKLSENMNRYYFPSGPRAGTNRRMHTFCSVLGLPLNPDGVTLSPAAIATMDARIQAFADWYTKNDPNILTWVTMNATSSSPFNPIVNAWVTRAGDWKWLADKWTAFVQHHLTAEGP
jgi:hypothetical protein